MQEPKTWDLSLFLEHEDPRVAAQIRLWVNEIQQNYELQEPFTISFVVPDGALTPEGASMQVFERLLMTYANVGTETRLRPGWEKGKGTVFSADFTFTRD